jgi:hypothetical protein
MIVTASFFGPIRRPFSEQSKAVELPEGADIQKALAVLGYRPEETRRIGILVNGKKADLSTALSDRDDVQLTLLAGGG